MSRTTLLVLLLAAGLGLVAWLLLGDQASKDLAGPGAGSALDPDAGPLDGTAGTGDAADAARQRVPTLLGQGRPRIGVGALTGRLARHPSQEPVAGFPLHLAGTGRGGEVVAVALTTDEHGAFRAADVPAADGLHLVLGRSDDPDHRLLVVHVDPGDVNDLGTLLLGRPGALTGRVVDAQGKGVVGARVEVHTRLFRSMTAIESFHLVFRDLGRPVTPLASALSGADGAFRIEGVPAGDITFVATASGFAPLIRHHRAGGEGTEEAGTTLTLVSARRAAGRVLDADGRGVAEAVVAFVADVSGPESFRFAGLFAATDRHGRFEDAAVPPGRRVQAIVVAEGHPPGIFSMQDAVLDDDLVFTLGARATTEVRVVDLASREPVEGADLLFVFGEMGARRGQRNSVASVVTDEDGRATFPTEPGPVVWVMVRHPTWGSLAWVGEGMPGGMAMGVEAPEGGFVVKEGFHRMEIGLRAPSWVEGRVTTKDGQPVPGAQVSVQSGFGGRMSALTDATGRYRLPLGTSGGFMPAMVQASAPGLVLEGGEARVTGEGGGGPGPQVVQQDLVLVPAVLVLGRVVDATGQPVTGAEISVQGVGRGDNEMRTPPRGLQATTDARGRFVLDGLAGGTKKVTLRAEHADYIAAQGAALDLPERGEVRADDLVLQSGTTVTVTVVDEGGQAVEGLSVTLRPTSGNFRDRQSVTTDAAGGARFLHVAAGDYEFTLEDPRHARFQHKQPVPDAPTHAVRFVVRPARPLGGQVVTDGDQPVADAEIVVFKVESDETKVNPWEALDRARTDAEGRFQVHGLPPDAPLRLHIEHEGHRTMKLAVALEARDLRIVLVPLPADVKARIAELQREQEALMKRAREAMQGDPATLNDRMSSLGTERQRVQDELDRLRSGE